MAHATDKSFVPAMKKAGALIMEQVPTSDKHCSTTHEYSRCGRPGCYETSDGDVVQQMETKEGSSSMSGSVK